MKILLALSILLTGCAAPNWHEWKEARNNFIYVEDEVDEWLVYDRIDEPFMGDCEDMAFTLQRQIGGEVMKAYYKNMSHAVLIKDGYIYDNILPQPVRAEVYDGVIVGEIKQ